MRRNEHQTFRRSTAKFQARNMASSRKKHADRLIRQQNHDESSNVQDNTRSKREKTSLEVPREHAK